MFCSFRKFNLFKRSFYVFKESLSLPSSLSAILSIFLKMVVISLVF